MKFWDFFSSRHVRFLEREVVRLQAANDELLKRILKLALPLPEDASAGPEGVAADESAVMSQAMAKSAANFDLMREYERFTQGPNIAAQVEDYRTLKEEAEEAALRAHKRFIDTVKRVQSDTSAAITAKPNGSSGSN